MSDKLIPKSHGSFGHVEMGEEFTTPEETKVKVSGKNNIASKFKRKKKKANQVARQNLE
ncbi:hypothetical protein [Rummeliibacillus pycnus]|uniref:hypothetical protein n=1 Tax=Rummeliibacillus pycnus TaxID=101070 RepID=UPI003D271C11